MLPNISAGRKSELGFTPVLALAKLGKSTVQGLYLQEQPKLVSFACVRAGGRKFLQPTGAPALRLLSIGFQATESRR